MSTTIVLNLTSFGHINPTLPLIAELVKRGERVIYYSIEPFRAIIEGSGAEYRAYDSPELLIPKTHQGELFSVMAHFGKAAKAILPELLADIRKTPVDYLLLDSMCIWGNLVQQILKLPAVTFSSIFLMHKDIPIDDMLDMTYSHLPQNILLNGLKGLYSYFETSKEIEAKHDGNCPGLIESFTNTQDVNIVFSPRDFHPMPEKYSEAHYKFVGPSISERTENIDFPFDEIESAAFIYISLGTINNQIIDFYQACYEAFGNGAERPFPYKVILSIGNKISAEDIGKKPDNFLVLPKVPQLEILKKCHAFVTHGGMNSIGEALFYGVPMLVIPRRGDQFLVAKQVEKTSVGKSLSTQDVTPESLYNAVTGILQQPDYQKNSRRMGQACEDAGGYKKAADEIFSYKNVSSIRARHIV